MRDVNEGRITDGTLVRITDPAFSRIQTGGSRIELGAGVTMAAVLASRDLAFLHPAARAIGGPAVRNAATVGRQPLREAPYGDFAVALLALDAQVTVQAGYGGGRAMPLEEFLAGRDRGGQGLVTAVQFARPAIPPISASARRAGCGRRGSRSLDRRPSADVGGRVAGARVAYGAMAPTPIRAKGVERALEGRPLDQAGIGAARQAAAEGTRPATDAIASEWYRREVLPVHLGRLLAAES
jgi:CO/xanthine dehydrogenase FAD-binding subunit